MGASDDSHRFGREVLKRVWPTVTGREATLAELQIAGAQAHLESNYGKASYTNNVTGEKSGTINNWGAVQSGKPPCGDGGFEASDSRADGTKYTWCYKRYPTPEDGARHLVEHMTVKRPASWRLMQAGDIDGWARQMHSYKTDEQGNHVDKNGNVTSDINQYVRNLDPDTGTPGYFEQTPLIGQKSRAYGVELRIKDIAAANQDPVIAAKRGGPVSVPDEGGGTGLTVSRTWVKPALVGGGLAALLALLARLIMGGK